MATENAGSRRGGGGGSGRFGIVAALVAVAALAGAYLSECITGLNVAAPTGQQADAQKAGGDEKSSDAPAAKTGAARSVVVQGDDCELDGAPKAPCAQVCETLKAAAADTKSKSKGGGEVNVDATHGSHGVVVELKSCLEGAGYDVDLRTR